MKITAIIVEDEPLARERVRLLLTDEKDIRIAAECANGVEALRVIEQSPVDMMFLDIQMPAMDGIQLVQRIPQDKLPVIIFTTAFDEFAVKAFELNAIDYLLKPFTKKRFQESLNRARVHFRSNDKDLYLSQMLNTIQTMVNKKTYSDKIVIKSEGKVRFLKSDEILWIESDANYLRIHTQHESPLIRDTMTNFYQRLNPQLFLRIHRTVIVNASCIREIKPWFNDEVIALLNNGTQLPIGRTYRKSVNAFFQL